MIAYTTTLHFWSWQSRLRFLDFTVLCDRRSTVLTCERSFFVPWSAYSQGSSMPPSTAHTPSAADLGGPVVVPILVTVPLSNNGAKTAAKPLGTCPITLPSVLSFTFIVALLWRLWASLSQKSSLQVHQLENHGSLSHGSVSNRLVLPSGCLSIVKCKFHLTLCASKLRQRGVVLAL